MDDAERNKIILRCRWEETRKLLNPTVGWFDPSSENLYSREDDKNRR